MNAGYKSRVRYLSVLDPTLMCYYTSEILDAGLPGPLFMVNKLRTPLHTLQNDLSSCICYFSLVGNNDEFIQN